MSGNRGRPNTFQTPARFSTSSARKTQPSSSAGGRPSLPTQQLSPAAEPSPDPRLSRNPATSSPARSHRHNQQTPSQHPTLGLLLDHGRSPQQLPGGPSSHRATPRPVPTPAQSAPKVSRATTLGLGLGSRGLGQAQTTARRRVR